MQTQTAQQQCLSHTLQQPSADVHEVVTQLCKKIRQQGDHPYATVQQQIDMVQQLAQFGIGQYLLLHRGLNAHWSRYLKLLYPEKYRALGTNIDGEPFTPMESWYLNTPPAQATQESWRWCREQLQQHVCDGATLASVPCGALDDLLELNFANCRNISLIGVDVDPDALRLAQENVQAYGLSKSVKLLQADAWNMHVNGEWDVLTSKGLAGYEPDPKRLLQLYQQFYQALKPQGILITNLWVPRENWPTSNTSLSAKQRYDLQLFEVLTRHILQVRWSYTTQEKVHQLLQQAGFTDICFQPSSSGICIFTTARRAS
ncbi:MAG: class I SAM-dependent methyltransferase [Myxococcota bacterium]